MCKLKKLVTAVVLSRVEINKRGIQIFIWI